MESKGTRDVPQVDQPDLYLPSESELQMAQVGIAIGVPVKQIKVLLYSRSLQSHNFLNSLRTQTVSRLLFHSAGKNRLRNRAERAISVTSALMNQSQFTLHI